MKPALDQIWNLKTHDGKIAAKVTNITDATVTLEHFNNLGLIDMLTGKPMSITFPLGSEPGEFESIAEFLR